MILTLTLNPSLDRTLQVESLRRGAVIRADATRLDPGGKGVNVTRALLANGIPSCAVIPYGGPDGRRLLDLLSAEAIEMIPVEVAGPTRSNIALAEPDGTVTKVNEAGFELTAGELDRIAQAVLDAARSADWVVASGSLPPGVPTEVYAWLAERFARAGINVAVDTSGPALVAALAGGPALVKPNRDELAEATGSAMETVGDVIKASIQLGCATVLASLGADGALLVQDGRILHGACPIKRPRSSVGAGDALLAGFLAAGARGEAALVEGLAWATAAVGQPGSRMPTASDIRREAVQIREPDPAQPLSSGD
ncbi:1-phosphofructokinase family hexose kinase [Streptosporangiaceae bacterium NEAU-GS5]|nr:1-phosphofructokinase family hexose kinase [Streptosporangiaceae bacterium NEAU-GS5]